MRRIIRQPLRIIRQLLNQQAGSGQLLMLAAALAMIIANSGASEAWFVLLKAHIGPLSVLHWINDGLMAMFFLLVGLELKRELVVGEMANWSARLLPGAAALAGMAAPVAIFLALNRGAPANLPGWAIPAATDIAFALGVLALLGDRVPTSLKLLLTAIAIIDDLGAIVIIAAFYTQSLDFVALGAAVSITLAMVVMARRGVTALWPYLLLGTLLWIAAHASGIHATLAGVVTALCIPLGEDAEHGPLVRLEHALSPLVSFGIVPLFGLANAGVSLAGVRPADLLAPLPLGIAAGLVLGKAAGIFLAMQVMTRSGLARAPHGAGVADQLGLAILCGIGFTMSLFISALAFGEGSAQEAASKIGILAGSVVAALLGAAVLGIAGRRTRQANGRVNLTE